ncbi:hypothetical protein FE257_001911 [Aspergillus nanangensis]|uniref:Fe2OG dioxygenase domain-containing protein n=1 Tax=Aspergillus nanangensis TaxID=2582783 RepID=A0AAD4CD55_ASPNN|nr:hypothetical protein FE257_001911 [Aspergillus nanangensis]
MTKGDSTTFMTRFGEVHTKGGDEVGGFDSLPIVDVANLGSSSVQERQLVAADIFDVCKNVGFFYVKNHGIPQETIDTIHTMAAKFFALPDEVKMESYIGNSADINWQMSLEKGVKMESFSMGYERAADHQRDLDDSPPSDPYNLHGPNQWPRDEAIPGFREAYLRYHADVLEFSRKLIRILALALDLPEEYFDKKVKDPGTNSRLVHYMARDVSEERTTGLAPHTDCGCFTILSQNDVLGLQVLNGRNEWVNAQPIPGTFVVNLGDIFTYWTNGLFRSTHHRAINMTGEERYSIPFFFSVGYNESVAPLQEFVSEEKPPIKEEFVYGAVWLSSPCVPIEVLLTPNIVDEKNHASLELKGPPLRTSTVVFPLLPDGSHLP